MQVFGAVVCLVLCCLVVCAVSVEHGARLDEIVTRKTAEAKHAHQRANSAVNEAKTRAEMAAQANKRILTDSNTAKDLHDYHISTVQNVARDSPESASGTAKMHTTLNAHGVSSALIKEINNMATAKIPRETIVKHVQTHFPNKEPHEWNDIVISAISADGKAQPNSLETNKAEEREAAFRRQKFQLAKDSFESTMDA